MPRSRSATKTASALEPNNLIAINSLIGYRALRYGKHLDLIITDQHSYRSPDPFSDPSLEKLGDWEDYDGMFPEDLHAGPRRRPRLQRRQSARRAPFRERPCPNPQKNAPPQTILGAEQKAWFKDQLKRATATWKIWGNSQGTLDERADPENLPAGLTKQPWPAGRSPMLGGGDHGTAWIERSEIYDLVRDAKITGFAIVSGDLHSFWAGYASAQLPPGKFEPVGLSFVGASLSSAGRDGGHEHKLPEGSPLRPLYLADRPGAAKPDWTFNMLLKHGVRSCLEYAKSFDLERARRCRTPTLAPHLEFVDMGGHGYATVRLTGDECGPSSSASRGRSRAASAPTAGRCAIASSHSAKLWRQASGRSSRSKCSKAIPGLSI